MDVLLIAEQLRRAVPGGIGTYIRGLVQGLESIDSDDLNITLYASRTRQRPDPLDALGLGGPFLLTVGTVEPRKNLVRLLAAYEEARRKLPDPWPLLVVGPPGWGQTVRPPQGAVLAGHVSDPVLAGLYASARCLVYVPLQEGFGLPAVEGMAACLPVVASPMPSIADAGLQVDPLDVAAIADAIVQAATGHPWRSGL